MEDLEEKLLKELHDDALVISCRFQFPNWPPQLTAGSGLEQTFAYDMRSVRSHLNKVQRREVREGGVWLRDYIVFISDHLDQ